MPHLVDAPVKPEENAEGVPAGHARVITRLEMPASAPAPAASGASPPVAPEPRGFSAADILRYEADLLRRAAALTGRDMNRARDLVQDSLERAIRNVGRVVPGSNLRAWLYVILANRYQDLYRSERTWAVVPLGDQHHPTVPPPEPPARWTAVTPADLRAALAELNPDLRAAFEYREFEQLSYEQIGRIMGVPVATVGTRLCRARARLKEILTARLNLEECE
jgi:RNA polymerase sigma-70 factor (ECF subfamily)